MDTECWLCDVVNWDMKFELAWFFWFMRLMTAIWIAIYFDLYLRWCCDLWVMFLKWLRLPLGYHDNPTSLVSTKMLNFCILKILMITEMCTTIFVFRCLLLFTAVTTTFVVVVIEQATRTVAFTLLLIILRFCLDS